MKIFSLFYFLATLLNLIYTIYRYFQFNSNQFKYLYMHYLKNFLLLYLKLYATSATYISYELTINFKLLQVYQYLIALIFIIYIG